MLQWIEVTKFNYQQINRNNNIGIFCKLFRLKETPQNNKTVNINKSLSKTTLPNLFQPISKKTDQIQGKHTKRRLSKYELIDKTQYIQ